MTDRQTDRQTEQYYVTDWIKFLAAICVVAIHTGLGNSINNPYISSLIYYFESLAVPFFFCFSGFAFRMDLESKKANIFVLQRKKFLHLYHELSLIYLPLAFYGWICDLLSGRSIFKVLFDAVRKYILVGEQFYSWPLWYLLAMIFGLTVLKHLKWRVTDKKVWLWALLFFLIAFAVNKLSGLKFILWTIGNGRVFTAPAYLLLGILVYNKQEDLKKYRKFGMVIVVGIIAASVVLGVEYSTTSITAFISLPWILSFAVAFKGSSSLAMVARKASTLFYYAHMYFFFIWGYVLAGITQFKKIRENGVGAFCFTLICCTMFSAIVLLVKERKKRISTV